jgi:hypothetical protein
MTTIGKITEQIYRIYSGGNPSDDAEITKSDIKLLVGQSINKFLKSEYFNVNRKMDGSYFPPHAMISTYTITSGLATYETSKAKVKLPIFPISLPRDMGVWSVSPIGDADQQYIPLQSGQYTLLSSQDVLKYLDYQTGYYVDGQYLIFTKDITASPFNVSQLKVRLLTVDATVLDDYDYVALPADMEDVVIKDVLQFLGVVPKLVDKVSDSNNQL